MAKIGLFFGSTTGNTQDIAERIQKEFGGNNVVTLHDISEVEKDEFSDYEKNHYCLSNLGYWPATK